ncbi:hypothetical protein BJY52DRAFT_117199 [Lactarius psammicola]|nr:hypothetical protein BJY52DRAFT_117199 [Lactarius psammicola]
MMSSISPLSLSPPPALAASRARRQRSNAISRAHESEAEWDFASASAATDTSGSPTTTSALPPWRDDELICPLAPDTHRAHADPHAQVHAHLNANADAKAPSWVPVHVWPANEGELQAVLAQFAFPGPASGRKHRRSGEVIVDNNSPTSVGSPSGSTTPAAAGSGKRRSAPGPTRCTWCAHCERGRSGA